MRAQETELPRQVSIGFTDALTDYRRSAVDLAQAGRRRQPGAACRPCRHHQRYGGDAAREVWLQDLWAGRERAEFAVGDDCARAGAGRRDRADAQ